MRFALVRFGLALISVFAISSCANIKDVIKEKDEGNGVMQTYTVGAHQAYAISKKILRNNGAETIEEHEQEGYILGTAGKDEKSYGTFMGVWIEKTDKPGVNVTVVTKRKIRVQLLTRLTEERFHAEFAKELAALPPPDAVSEAQKETKPADADTAAPPAASKKTPPATPKKLKKKK